MEGRWPPRQDLDTKMPQATHPENSLSEAGRLRRGESLQGDLCRGSFSCVTEILESQCGQAAEGSREMNAEGLTQSVEQVARGAVSW